MRVVFYLILSSIFIVACKDETPAKVSPAKSIATKSIVFSQQFETAMFDLKLDEDSLKAKGIKSFMATQVFANGKPSRFYFHSFETKKGAMMYADLLGKDTIISQRIIDEKNGVVNCIKKWHQINRVVKVIEYSKDGFDFIVENEKGKIDSVKIKRKNNQIASIDYLTRKEKEWHVFYKKDKEKVSYIQHVKDTLYQYENTWADGRIVSTRYLRDLRHTYTYSYAQNGSLIQIVWNENSRKINATIDFDYDKNGLLSKRIITSSIPAFGNSETTYQFKK